MSTLTTNDVLTVPQPDANGEFDTPLDGALWMASFGIPQTPLKGKAPFLPEWQKKASTDPNQIREWFEGTDRQCNFGSVALPGGFFVFEADTAPEGVPSVRERFEKQGGRFTSQLMVASRRDGSRGHRYYKWIEGIENIGQNATIHGDFSLRADAEQCVSPGSVHPDTEKQYRVISSGTPEPPAAQELAFWKSEKKVEKPTAAAATDDAAAIPTGRRNSTLTSKAGELRAKGLNEEEIAPVLVRLNQERCIPPLDESEVKTIAHSIGSRAYQPDVFAEEIAAKAEQAKRAQQSGLLSPGQQKPDVSNWRQEFKSVGELEKGEVRMLINNFLPEGTTFIGGLPGEGKTLLALSIAKALTTGADFLGCVQFNVPSIVPILYLIPEVAARAFRQRCERFHIPDDPNLFLCRTISEGPTLLLDNAMVLEAVKRMKPVVFLDTVLRFNEAEDENAASQNKVLVEDIIRLRHEGAVAIVGLHHSTKNMHKEGMSLETVLRGTGDLAAMCDAVYGLLRDDALYKHNSGPNEIDVACVKPRDFEPPELFRIAASYRSNKPGIIGPALGIASYIDDLGDFQMVSKAETERAIGDWLESVVKDDPAITLAELEKSTKLSSWVIRQTLKNRGWTKARGGAKGASLWRKGSGGPSVAFTPASAGSKSMTATFD